MHCVTKEPRLNDRALLRVLSLVVLLSISQTFATVASMDHEVRISSFVCTGVRLTLYPRMQFFFINYALYVPLSIITTPWWGSVSSLSSPSRPTYS